MENRNLQSEEAFLDYVRDYQGEHTYLCQINLGMRDEAKFARCRTIGALKQTMKDDKSGYFEPRHYGKVDEAYRHYLELCDNRS